MKSVNFGNMSFNLIDNAKMGRIISVGDKIPCKIFGRIHSRFEHVLNFNIDGLIVSIVTQPVDAGPLRIVMDNIDLKTISEARLGHDDLKINNLIKYTRSTSQTHNSSWKPGKVDRAIIKANLNRLREFLINSSKKSSLCIQLVQETSPELQHGFDKELYNQFKQAYASLLNRDLAAAIPGFRGRGYGLTPSGDDFIIGLLLGFTSIQQCGNKEMSNIRSYVYSHSIGKNQLVNTFLLQSYHGWYNENWKKLLSSMMEESGEPEIKASDILSQGETSGADTLTGFLTAWELELKG